MADKHRKTITIVDETLDDGDMVTNSSNYMELGSDDIESIIRNAGLNTNVPAVVEPEYTSSIDDEVEVEPELDEVEDKCCNKCGCAPCCCFDPCETCHCDPCECKDVIDEQAMFDMIKNPIHSINKPSGLEIYDIAGGAELNTRYVSAKSGDNPLQRETVAESWEKFKLAEGKNMGVVRAKLAKYHDPKTKPSECAQIKADLMKHHGMTRKEIEAAKPESKLKPKSHPNEMVAESYAKRLLREFDENKIKANLLAVYKDSASTPNEKAVAAKKLEKYGINVNKMDDNGEIEYTPKKSNTIKGFDLDMMRDISQKSNVSVDNVAKILKLSETLTKYGVSLLDQINKIATELRLSEEKISTVFKYCKVNKKM